MVGYVWLFFVTIRLIHKNEIMLFKYLNVSSKTYTNYHTKITMLLILINSMFGYALMKKIYTANIRFKLKIFTHNYKLINWNKIHLTHYLHALINYV